MKRYLAFALVITVLPTAVAVRAGDDAAAVKNLLGRLRKGDERVVPALARHGATAVPGLIEVVKEGNAPVQGLAMDALGQIGPAAKDAVPILAEGLAESSNDALAVQAARALGKIGAASVPELLKVLDKGTPNRTILVAQAIEMIGPDAKAAEPLLVKQLKAAKEPREEVVFVNALAALGPAAQDAVPTLVELAKERAKTATRIHILVGLGKMGPAAKEAVPLLVSVISDSKQPPHVRVHALTSLSQIAPGSKELADAVPAMVKGGAWPKFVLIETLARTGPVSPEARDILEKGLSAKDASIRVYAAQGLGKADPKDRAVASVLIESLQEKDPQVRRLAAVAIAEVRPTDPAVARTLQKVASDPEPTVRQAAAEALRKLQSK
jgi:HEAT repeat protein